MVALSNCLEIVATDKVTGEEWECTYDATRTTHLAMQKTKMTSDLFRCGESNTQNRQFQKISNLREHDQIRTIEGRFLFRKITS